MNSVILAYAGANLLFLLGGVLLLVASLLLQARINSPATVSNAADIVLLSMVPFKGAIVNAVFVFATFVLGLPGAFDPLSRLGLKLQGWMVVVCAIFTLALGLDIWAQTLTTRATLGSMWGKQTALMQSLLQQEFSCCGYFNSTSPPFVGDNVCTTALIAAETQGCVGPVSNFANSRLDLIFTVDFGIVAIDFIMLICVAVVLKDRKERERYRLIDAKIGASTI